MAFDTISSAPGAENHALPRYFLLQEPDSTTAQIHSGRLHTLRMEQHIKKSSVTAADIEARFVSANNGDDHICRTAAVHRKVERSRWLRLVGI